MTCFEQKERIDVCAFVRFSGGYDHCVQGLALAFLAHLVRVVQFFRFFYPPFQAIAGYIEMGSNANLPITFGRETAYVFGCSLWW